MLSNYLKTALKVLLRRKFFTFISLFAIAFTLAVLMVAVAVLDHAFGVHPPELNDDRVLTVGFLKMRGPNASSSGNPGYGFLDRALRDLPGAEMVSIASVPEGVVSFKGGERLRLARKRTDAAFWKITRFEFLEGGPFTEADDEAGRFVAVITTSVRDRLFGGSPALGRTFEADGQRFTVAGVVPDVSAIRLRSFADIYVPMGTSRNSLFRDSFQGDFIGLILARDEGDLAGISGEFQARVRGMQSPDPRVYPEILSAAEPLFDSFARQEFSPDGPDSGAGLLRAILAAGAILFMLLPTVNLVNINVSRILERSSEIGVRRAFGASRRSLLGQFVVENVIVTFVGGAIGLVFSALILLALNESGLISGASFSLNLRIFAWACFLALFFGLFSGLWPAWRMSRLGPVTALRGSHR